MWLWLLRRCRESALERHLPLRAEPVQNDSRLRRFRDRLRGERRWGPLRRGHLRNSLASGWRDQWDPRRSSATRPRTQGMAPASPSLLADRRVAWATIALPISRARPARASPTSLRPSACVPRRARRSVRVGPRGHSHPGFSAYPAKFAPVPCVRLFARSPFARTRDEAAQSHRRRASSRAGRAGPWPVRDHAGPRHRVFQQFR